MQKHNKQDTAIISLIVLAAFILILLVFGKSVQAKSMKNREEANRHAVSSVLQSQTDRDKKKDNLIDENESENYYTYTFAEDRILRQFFSN